jgi:EpsI family protein
VRSRGWFRSISVLVLLSATAVFLHDHDRPEILPARRPLSAFPWQIGNWRGASLPVNPTQLSVLGPGDFLVRDYQSVSGGEPVSLFIAYFPSQRTGDTIHSPKNCLPGAGWVPLESGRLRVRNADGSTMSINRYIVAKGLSRALVLYWYQAHERVTASEYLAKIRLVEDAVRMNRTDGALVRIVVPFDASGGTQQAQSAAVCFIAHIQPMLHEFIPR